jgi:hypothetical protein
MGFTHITTCGSVGGGGGGGGSNVTSLNYDISTETLTLGTDAPSVFSTIWPIKLENTIHVAKNGNDADALASTVQPFSLQVPFLTINAAYDASNSSSTIVIWPGKYILPATIDVDFTKARNIHCMPGVSIQNAIGVAINFTASGTFNWTGYAVFQCHTFFFQASADLVNLNVEGDYAFNDNLLSNQYFANIKNMNVDIRLNELRNLGFYAISWRSGFIGIDKWTCTSQNLIYCDVPDPTYLSNYGPAKLVMGGRSAPKGLIQKSENSITNTGIFFEAQVYKYWDLSLELNFDVEWIDGYFIVQGNGNIILNGNVYPTKSNNLGNELPWYISNSPFESLQDEKPCFRHNGNSINRKYKPNDEPNWFLNNTGYFFQAAGQYYLNGFYQGLGTSDNGVAGDFPIVSITDDSLGYDVYVTFEGVLKQGAPRRASLVPSASVGPVKVNSLSGNQIYLNFMDTILVCKSDDKIQPPIWTSSLLSPVPIRVNHSLTMSGPINLIDFPIFYSFDRTSVDSEVDYQIEEYGR